MTFSTKNQVVILVILTGLTLASTLLITLQNYSPIPWYDEWMGSVSFLTQISDGNYAAFLQLHNEHWIVFHKVVLWFDYMINGRFSNLEIYVNYALIALTCFIFIRFFQKNTLLSPSADKSDIYLFSLFVIGFLFQYIQGNNLLIRFQSSLYFAIVFPLASFYFLAKSIESKKWIHLFISCILGACTLGAAGMGVFVLPLLLAMQLWYVRDYVKIGFLVIFSGLFFMGYGQVFREASHQALSMELVFENIWVWMLFLFKYLGSPFYYLFGKDLLPIGAYAGILFGLVFLGILAMVIWKIIRQKRLPNPFQSALILFAGYIVLTAAATALGRVEFGTDYAFKTRYTSFTMVGWVALIAAACFSFNNLRKIFFFPFAMVLFQGLLLNAYLLYPKAEINQHLDHCWIGCRHLKYTGGLAASLGVRDSLYLQHIFPPNVDYPLQITAEAETRKIGIFGKDLDGLRQQLIQTVPDSDSILLSEGVTIESFTEIPGEEKFVRVIGWIDPDESGRASKVIQLRNHKRQVIGFAVTGTPRPDLKARLGSQYHAAGFVGYLLNSPPR